MIQLYGFAISFVRAGDVETGADAGVSETSLPGVHQAESVSSLHEDRLADKPDSEIETKGDRDNS
jgi:hypothetical protein